MKIRHYLLALLIVAVLWGIRPNTITATAALPTTIGWVGDMFLTGGSANTSGRATLMSMYRYGKAASLTVQDKAQT